MTTPRHPTGYSVIALADVPLIRPGDDLGVQVLAAMAGNGLAFADGDILVVAQKIVSKAEGRQVALDSVTPSPAAHELARTTGKDPRLIELILAESQAVVRTRPDLIIVRHRLGQILANAGIDRSNVLPPTPGETGAPSETHVLLWPQDPDASAARLREQLRQFCGADVAVVITDSIGRPWRMGTVGTAIGVAGLPALLDLRGQPDLNGRPLESSEVGLADEISAAAALAMGEGNEGRPMVVIRGLPVRGPAGTAGDLLRPASRDLFL